MDGERRDGDEFSVGGSFQFVAKVVEKTDATTVGNGRVFGRQRKMQPGGHFDTSRS